MEVTTHKQEEEITLSEVQRQTDEWIHTYGVRYFNELTNMTILTEEASTKFVVCGHMATCRGVILRKG